MVVKAGFARAFAVLLLAVTGQGNKPNIGKLRRLTDEAGDLGNVETRESDIEQNDIGPEGFCSIDYRGALVNFLRDTAQCLKEQAERSRSVDVVLHDQDPQTWADTWSTRGLGLSGSY